ncbi:MAG: methyl-accepting chemotaxis protein [Treponemataceae bacterium]
MNTLKFTDYYSDASPEIKKKAPMLRIVILIVMVLMPIVAITDFLTADIVNSAIETLIFALFAVSYFLLNSGRYDAASRMAVYSAFSLLFLMTIIVSDPNPMHLYRNSLLFMLAISFGGMFMTARKQLVIMASIGAVAHIAFVLFRLLPAGLTIRELINYLVVSEVVYGLACFFVIKSTFLSWTINRELDAERAQSADRIIRLSSVVEGSRINMESMSDIATRVREIRSLIAESTEAVRAIEVRVGQLEGATDNATAAAQRIAQRVDGLNGNIEEESTAQIQSSASINEMVASIRSVADSAGRRRVSMAGLAGTAEEGMRRLDALLAFIGKIEGSIDSIQSMVAVINGIAGSTNLLSMNAAIEAAHAGDAGRGFAVVADEIRKLADTSGKNAKEIGRQLKEVIAVITNAAEESGRTRDAFSEIHSEIDGAMNAFEEITSATGELAEGGKQILDALKTLSEMSALVKNGGGEISEAQQTLAQIQVNMREALGALRTDATTVLRKDDAVLVAATGVAEIGERGIRFAEDLHKRSAAAGV